MTSNRSGAWLIKWRDVFPKVGWPKSHQSMGIISHIHTKDHRKSIWKWESTDDVATTQSLTGQTNFLSIYLFCGVLSCTSHFNNEILLSLNANVQRNHWVGVALMQVPSRLTCLVFSYPVGWWTMQHSNHTYGSAQRDIFNISVIALLKDTEQTYEWTQLL